MGVIADTGRPQTVRLLALDGGGVRGLSSLIILRHLMRQIDPLNPPRPCEYFSLIGGTSTGGLIAIMLGRLCMDIDSCIEAYKDLSARAFVSERAKLDFLRRRTDKFALRGAYSADRLKETMRDLINHETSNPDTVLKPAIKERLDTHCKVFVCAVNKSTNKLALFRTYDRPGIVESSWSNCKIWEAARATSAATMFFEPITISRQTFVDGATSCNNPIQQVWLEAGAIWPDIEWRVEHIVSIGTGRPHLKGFGNNVIDVIKTLRSNSVDTEAPAIAFYQQCQGLRLESRYLRLNVDNGLADVGLSEHSKQDYIVAITEAYLKEHDVCSKISKFVSLVPPPVSMWRALEQTSNPQPDYPYSSNPDTR